MAALTGAAYSYLAIPAHSVSRIRPIVGAAIAATEGSTGSAAWPVVESKSHAISFLAIGLASGALATGTTCSEGRT